MNVDVLISEKELDERIGEIAKQIENDYKGEEVVFCSVLKGAIFFTVDLMKKYQGDCEINFVRVSSYQGENSTGVITMKIPLKKEDIENKNIILVEDIVDTGRTFKYLVEYLKEMNLVILLVLLFDCYKINFLLELLRLHLYTFQLYY